METQMTPILKIRANDEQDGVEIIIGYEPVTNEFGQGYQLIASNGDDISYYRPKSITDCVEAARAMYGQWDTVEDMDR